MPFSKVTYEYVYSPQRQNTNQISTAYKYKIEKITKKNLKHANVQ